MWLNLKRIMFSGAANFWRGGVVSLAAVLVLCVALFVVGALVLGSAFLNNSLTDIEQKVDIAVSFKPEAAEADIQALKDQIKILPGVAEVAYSSREDELKSFQDRNKDNSLLMQSLDEVGNPFGARLNIRAVDPSQYESIAAFLNKDNALAPGNTASIIDRVSFKKDIVDRLIAVTRSARRVGFAVSIVLGLISILVTYTTVALTIHASREEIAVMRLVGASGAYVSGPFVVEGVIAGLIAAFITMGVLYPVAIWVRNATSAIYGGVDLLHYYLDNFAYLFLILLGSGIILGIVSSLLAIRRYLRV